MEKTPLHCVFLPGMMCDERLFEPQIKYLEQQCGAATSVVSLSQGNSFTEYSESVHRLISDYEDHQTVLIGLSMGGIVAMQCVQDFPKKLSGLVLMDTNPLAESSERKALRFPQIERALAGELDNILIEEMKPQYLAPVNRENDALLALVLTMARELGPDVFARQSAALMNRPDYSNALQRWLKPTIVVCGQHDTLCPVDRHELIQSLLTHSSLHVIDDAGHLPTLETPQQVNSLLIKFLRNNGFAS